MNINLRAVAMITVSLGLAGGTALYAKNWITAERDNLISQIKSQPAAKEEANTTQILVASEPIEAGSFVREDNLQWYAWPSDAVADAYVEKGEANIADLSGAVARATIPAKAPILDAQLVHPGERGFLAAVVAPGKRAVSVPVTATTGISGFVFPGDRVDLLLSVKYRVGETKRNASKTILEDLRVLAIDQAIQNEDGEAKVGKTATLEVTPKEAESIAVAEHMGTLSLSLRSVAREEDDKALPLVTERNFTEDSKVFRIVAQDLDGGGGVMVLRGNPGKKQEASEDSMFSLFLKQLGGKK